MGNNRSIMSENLKEKIAQELGVYRTVQNEGWELSPQETVAT